MTNDQGTIEQHTVNIRGVEHYLEWVRTPTNGQPKPVMVFIHGWSGSARYWHSTAQALTPYFNCLLYDMRGFGRSLIPPRMSKLPHNNLSYELEEYAEDLRVLLDTLNLDVVYLNSHSMGASVATLFINKYPDRVKKAILTCNGIFEYNERAFKAFHKFGSYVVKFRYNWFLKVPLADKMFMARFLYRPIPTDLSRSFLEDFLLANYEAAVGTIYTSVSKKAVEIMPKEFARLSIPTLLISGEKDIIIPAEMGRQAAALNKKNINYVEIRETAHFPMLEDEVTYLEKVKDFLNINKINEISEVSS